MSHMRLSELAPNVGFGTSGVRALVTDLQPTVVQAYTCAFVRYLRSSGQMQGTQCVVGWDLRPSSPSIAASVCAALQNERVAVDLAGCLPTPALALRALTFAAPGIMVTGSHIPFDRNGIKFYTAKGEILKSDELSIAEQDLSDLVLTDEVSSATTHWTVQVLKSGLHTSSAVEAYLARYLSLLPHRYLSGLRVGVYQHSAVGRDLLVQLLEKLGCEVIPLGRSDSFVPIDTEAVSADDEQRAAQWCTQEKLDALVSTDGDGDRPWVCDEQGKFVRGDVLGILTARWLGANTVVTPVSSNTALEKSGFFSHCARTRIGSPYVIEAMQQLALGAADGVAGFEANGGFLLQSPLRQLRPLPTRDSALPIIAILALAQERGLPLSSLVGELPPRFTQSDRIKSFPTESAHRLLKEFQQDTVALRSFLAFASSEPHHIDTTDGLRVTLVNEEIVHLRPSGNAPELRCYVEATTPGRATALLAGAMRHLNQLNHELTESDDRHETH